MPITDAQIQRLKEMCPVAGELDLGQLIQDAESGGLTAGGGIDITEGVISAAVDDATVEVGDSGLQVKAVDTDQIADEAITLAKLAAAVASAIRENALAALAPGETVIRGQITLAAANPTTVQIAGSPNAATLLGSQDGPFGLTVGNTFIVNPNGVGNQTWTVAGTAGASTGDTGCSTDMSAEVDNKLRIKVDDDADWTEVEFDWSAGGGCNTGAKIATEMQTKIRAKGGTKALVTVAYSTDHYVVTSADKGTGSKVLITEAVAASCTEELKLGALYGASEAAGTGDAPLLSKAAASVVAAKIAALHASLAATAAEASKIRLNATGSGGSSSLVVGNGTENTELGFTNTQADYGDVGLGVGHAMADANYTVVVTPVSNSPGTADVISVYNKAAGSFDVYAETPTAIPVEVILVGEVAT